MKKTKQKAKKGKGGKTKETWSHDGGAVFVEGAKAVGKVFKKGVPRQTQEKDEWIRRGRLKSINRQRTENVVKKLTKKLKFTDVLDEPLDESKPQVNERIRFEPPAPNRQPAILRLRQFLRAEDDDDEDDVENDFVESEDESVLSDEEIGAAETHSKFTKLSDETADVEELNDQALAAENIVDCQGEDFWRLKQFASTLDGNRAANNKLTLLDSLHDMEVLGTVIDANTSSHFVRVRKVGEIPNLPNVLRPYAEAPVGSPLESMLLSYLLTYGDALIEGRDYHNDAAFTKAVVYHTAVHLVKSK